MAFIPCGVDRDGHRVNGVVGREYGIRTEGTQVQNVTRDKNVKRSTAASS